MTEPAVTAPIPAPARRTRRVWLRVLLALCAILVLLPLAAGIAAAVLFDPASLAPRVEQALYRATGRDAHLGGLRVAWSFAPAFSVEGLTLANAPGGSEPAMLEVPHADIRVALLPLLSRRLEISRVVLTNPRLLLETDAAGRGNWVFARPAAEGTASAQLSTPGTRFVPELRRIELRDGTLRLRDGRTGRALDVGFPRLDLEDAASGALLSGTAQAAGRALDVQGKAGPLSRLLDTSAAGLGAAPWPFTLGAEGGGVRLSATGALPAAPSLAGMEAALNARVADLAALEPSLPLHDAELSARWGAAGLVDLTAKAGPADLSALTPGLALRSASLSAPAPSQPARIDIAGSLGSDPVTVSATILPRTDGQNDASGGTQAAVLRGLRVAGPFGDLAGDLAVTWAPRPALRGTLVSQRLDLDATRRLWPERQDGARQAAPPSPTPPSAPASPVPAQDRVIPDSPVPFDVLNRADGDLRWSAAAVRLGNQDWHAVELRAALAGGRLRLDPLNASAPGGQVQAVLQADAGQPEPSVGLKLALPSVALAPVMAALGRPDAGSGTGQGEADLRATGRTVRALASSLDGTAALTLVDGELDLQAAFPALVGLLRSAGIPAALRGRSPVRCLALSATAQHGAVQLRTGYVDASRLRLSAEGGLNLADETLALRLRPMLRLGPTETSVPLRLEGSFARPRTQLDEIAPGRVGAVIGGQRPQADECGPALLAARGGRDGPMPAAEPRPAPSSPADVLRRLLR